MNTPWSQIKESIDAIAASVQAKPEAQAEVLTWLADASVKDPEAIGAPMLVEAATQYLTPMAV